jgi:hypothetical protein
MPEMSDTFFLPRCRPVVADYAKRGYTFVRETELGVVLRHASGSVMTVIASGETRGGDQAGPEAHVREAWRCEPIHASE